MSATLIAQLLAAFGPSAVQLIDTLIAKVQANGDVTPEEWAALSAQLKQSASDVMKARIAAAGLDLNDPKVKALLALTL